MAIPKRTPTKKGSPPQPRVEAAADTCFVISPIGQPGSENHAKFLEVLEYVIKAGVSASGFSLRVVRADEIDRSGSFIKDILESLYGSYVVIADLTEQNPNVFYELVSATR